MQGEHDGHRNRLIEKLEEEFVSDQELIEITLFPFLPRKNTSDLAHRLLSHFGSVDKIYAATMEELRQIKGVGKNVAANLYCTGIMFRKYLRAKMQLPGDEFIYRDILPIVKTLYVGMEVEALDVFLLDKKCEIIERHRFSDGQENRVRLPAKEFSKLLMDEKVAGVVISHNHPGNGGCAPSNLDNDLTNFCQLACSMHGVTLCDHVIYSESGMYSYYLSRRLKQISKTHSVDNLLKKENGEKGD